jgi:hypothetical protein
MGCVNFYQIAQGAVKHEKLFRKHLEFAGGELIIRASAPDKVA